MLQIYSSVMKRKLVFTTCIAFSLSGTAAITKTQNHSVKWLEKTITEKMTIQGTELSNDPKYFWEGEVLLKLFTRELVGKTWPITMDEAWVGCSMQLPNFTVIIVVNGEPWALNGLTRGWAKNKKYLLTLGDEIRAVKVDSDSSELWWWAESNDSSSLGPKMSIDPIFELGKSMGCLD